MSLTASFQVYDTTLRDGAQQEGLSLSVQDKLAIARHLDDLGVGFIEGGWPGAIPKDTEFFRRAVTDLQLKNATLAAFGSTRRPGVAVAQDPQVQALVDSLAPVVTLVAKSDVRHVETFSMRVFSILYFQEKRLCPPWLQFSRLPSHSKYSYTPFSISPQKIF